MVAEGADPNAGFPLFPSSRFHSRELAAAAADAAAAAGDEEFQTSRGGGGDDLRGQGDGLLRESMVCPVFAALPQEQQLEAFEPAPKGTRKFVLVGSTLAGFFFFERCDFLDNVHENTETLL